MRLEIELIDPQQDRAADDQRKTHHPWIEQIALDVAAGGRPDHRRGQKRHQHADDESPVLRIGEHAERDPPQFAEIDRDDGENGAELNQHRKALPEIILAEIEKPFRQQQMAGGGHGQKFRDALDHAENHRLIESEIMMGSVTCGKSRVLLAYSHARRNVKRQPLASIVCLVGWRAAVPRQ